MLNCNCHQPAGGPGTDEWCGTWFSSLWISRDLWGIAFRHRMVRHGVFLVDAKTAWLFYYNVFFLDFFPPRVCGRRGIEEYGSWIEKVVDESFEREHCSRVPHQREETSMHTRRDSRQGMFMARTGENWLSATTQLFLFAPVTHTNSSPTTPYNTSLCAPPPPLPFLPACTTNYTN